MCSMCSIMASHPSWDYSTFTTKLPSFDQLVASVDHANAQTPQCQLNYQKMHNEKVDASPRLRLSSQHAETIVNERTWGRLISPTSHTLRRAPQALISPANPSAPPAELQITRSAFATRIELPQRMSMILPRSDVLPPLPVKDLPSASSYEEQDLALTGHPRKRAAQACQRCREMKMKCWLRGTGCTRCMRRGLECIFEQASNGLRDRRRKRATAPNHIQNPPCYTVQQRQELLDG